MKPALLTLTGALVLFASAPVAAATFVGPIPYLCFTACASPSPWAGISGMILDDFEDGALPLGISGGFPQFPSTFTDAVDADDGVIDGNGNGGISFFNGGSTNFDIVFNEAILDALPIRVGIVWTDGVNPITFEAFGPTLVSLGTIGPFFHADDVFTGTTAEDRFYGVEDPGGIRSIRLLSAGFGIGIEVDHLHYSFGPQQIPEPAGLMPLGLILAGVMAARRRTG